MGNKISVRTDIPHPDGDYWIVDNKMIIVPSPTSWKSEYKVVNAIQFPDEKLIFSIRKFEERNNRIYVKIYCHNYETNEISNDYFYSSKSDGYFWRYCFMHPSGGVFDKGYNYVTTTFVNMKLQEFIFDEMEKFNNIPRESECINRRSITDKILLERLVGTSFTSSHIFFKILDDIFPCEFESTGKPKMFDEYFKCLEKLNEEIVSKTKLDKTHLNLMHLQLLNDLKQCIERRGVFKHIEGSKTEHFTNVYKAFNDFFTMHFIYKVDTKRKLISNRIINIEGYSVVMNIYSIHISSPKITDQTYRAYYMVYKFKKPGADFTANYKKGLLQIIPITSKINKYGLDDRYVSAGYFINKIFDYKVQTGMFTFAGKEAGRDYLFMGEIVNMDSLPYDESTESLKIPEEKPRLVVRPFAGVPPLHPPKVEPAKESIAEKLAKLGIELKRPSPLDTTRPLLDTTRLRPIVSRVYVEPPAIPVTTRPPASPVTMRPLTVPIVVRTPSKEECVGGICRLKQSALDKIPMRRG